MNKVRILFFLWGILLLNGCHQQHSSPFLLEMEQGKFTFVAESKNCGPYHLELNEYPVLEGAHLFRGSDSLVSVSSSGGLDIIAVFKGNSEKASLQIKIFNPKDSSLEINSLKVTCEPESGNTQLPRVPENMENYLWSWLRTESAEYPQCKLNLSGSAILLLPGEGISLPPLYFFSHLCDE